MVVHMRIEIDTKNDSKEDIINAIKILQSAIGISAEDPEVKNNVMSNDPELLEKANSSRNDELVQNAADSGSDSKPDFVNIFQDFASKNNSQKSETSEARNEEKNPDHNHAETVDKANTNDGFVNIFADNPENTDNKDRTIEEKDEKYDPGQESFSNFFASDKTEEKKPESASLNAESVISYPEKVDEDKKEDQKESNQEFFKEFDDYDKKEKFKIKFY